MRRKTILRFVALFLVMGSGIMSASNAGAINMDFYYFTSPQAIVFRYEVGVEYGNKKDRGTASVVVRGMLNGNYAIDHPGITDYYDPWSSDKIFQDTVDLLMPSVKASGGVAQVFAPKGASRSRGNEYLLVDNKGSSPKVNYLAHPTDTECSSLRDIYIPLYNFLKSNYGEMSGDYYYKDKKDGSSTNVHYSAKLRDDYGFNVGNGGDDNGGHNGKLRGCTPGPVDSESGSSDGGSSGGGAAGTDGTGSGDSAENSEPLYGPDNPKERDNRCVQTATMGEICDEGEDGTGPINDVVETVATVASFGVGIAGVTGFTVTGIQYMMAAGNEELMRKSKRRMVEIVVGVAGYALIWALMNWLTPGGL